MVNNKGQASIEATLGIPLLWVTIALIIWIQGSGLMKAWVEHFTYEATVCLITYPNTANSCEYKLMKTLQALWPRGQLNLTYKKNKSSARLKGIFQLGSRSKIAFTHKVDIN